MKLVDQMLIDLPENTKHILVAISTELKRAEKKHPVWPTDLIHQAAIVGEESGELLQATINHKYENGNIESIWKESIQTGATCVRLLNSMINSIKKSKNES
jgi:hypothetical protein